MMDLKQAIAKTIAGAFAGVVMGWTTSALVLVGRVDAMEKTLIRIEARLDAISIEKVKNDEPR